LCILNWLLLHVSVLRLLLLLLGRLRGWRRKCRLRMVGRRSCR
jgi:hypothetical protein